MPKKPYPSQIAPKPKNPVKKTIGVMGIPKNKRMSDVPFKPAAGLKDDSMRYIGPAKPPVKGQMPKRKAAPMMANPYDTKLNVKKGIGATNLVRNTQINQVAALAQMAAKEAKMKKPAAPPTGIMGSTEKQRQDVRNAALKQMDIQKRQKKYNG